MNLNLILNEYLTKQEESRKERIRSGKWSPSMFGRCYRAQWWNRKNEKPSDPVDVFTQRRFLVGKCFHDFIQKILPQETVEVKVEEDDVLGFADIANEIVIDIKSVSPFEYKYIEKEDYDVAKKKYHNVLQLMYYVSMLGKQVGQISFIDVGTFNIREFQFYLANWKDKINQELETLRKYWKEDKLPPAEPRAFIDNEGKSVECKYCQFRDKCFLLEGKYVK